MTQMETYPDGTFCWVDLAAANAEVAKTFYTSLFGWGAQDIPVGDEAVYTMLNKEGLQVGALYDMGPEKRDQGIPTHWLSYISVSDVDAKAEKAQSLGGTLIAPAFDVMDAGRMAIVQDPTGAIFAFWQPGTSCGAQVVNEPGSLCWNELCTKELDVASDFYTALFGWSTKRTAGAGGNTYIEFHRDGSPVGGMLEIQPEWGEVSPNWSVYFAVDDCDAAVEAARPLGGKVEQPPVDIENVGRFAVIQDPQGAFFLVIQLDLGLV